MSVVVRPRMADVPVDMSKVRKGAPGDARDRASLSSVRIPGAGRMSRSGRSAHGD